MTSQKESFDVEMIEGDTSNARASFTHEEALLEKRSVQLTTGTLIQMLIITFRVQPCPKDGYETSPSHRNHLFTLLYRSIEYWYVVVGDEEQVVRLLILLIGNAKILNSDTGDDLMQTLHLTNHQYIIALMLFLVAYGVFELPSNLALKVLSPKRSVTPSNFSELLALQDQS